MDPIYKREAVIDEHPQNKGENIIYQFAEQMKYEG